MFACLRYIYKNEPVPHNVWIHWDQRPVIALWNRGYLNLNSHYGLSTSTDGDEVFAKFAHNRPELRKTEKPPRFISGQRKIVQMKRRTA